MPSRQPGSEIIQIMTVSSDRVGRHTPFDRAMPQERLLNRLENHPRLHISRRLFVLISKRPPQIGRLWLTATSAWAPHCSWLGPPPVAVAHPEPRITQNYERLDR